MKRILIAEDEPRISSFLQKGLKANGFTTTVVPHGDEALATAQSGEFDLLILDIRLPDKDGFEVISELRRTDTRTPVLILTARTRWSDTVTGLWGCRRLRHEAL